MQKKVRTAEVDKREKTSVIDTMSIGKCNSGEKDLTEIKVGERGIVVEICGGRNVAGRLNALGIVPGVCIEKKSAAMMRGPVVVQKGPVQIAIGYGMAKSIRVRLNNGGIPENAS